MPPRPSRGAIAEKPVEPIEIETPPAEVIRTRNAIVTGSGDEPVRREEIVKGFEFENGQYVVLEDEELRNIRPTTSKELQIVEFVRMAEIDPIFFETSYYVKPDEAGERPYGLLYQALRETGFIGLAQMAMHSRDHVVVLRPGRTGLIAHTMFYVDEVHPTEEFRADVSDLNARELNLAKRLIETMVAPFEPEKFRDTYRERVEQMIATKVAGREVSREQPALPPKAAVIDIMRALEESLRMSRKPVSPAAPRKPRAKRAG
jgi:DNA end-binding protein Ku